MTAVIEVTDLTKRYGATTALDGVSVTFQENVIHGLLGRNGAGKTTLMSIVTAQNFATSGRVRVFGEPPLENPSVLARMCFVRESQRYPDDAAPRHAFEMAALFYPRWDAAFAAELVEEFRLPTGKRIKKLSRGQLSAVGVILGLASRAEVTFFDEPYLGLDAVARQIFYDRLLQDYAEHPRTIVLSSHLIDEVAPLIEQVVLLDGGRVLLDEPADTLRNRAVSVVGEAGVVEQFVRGREVIAQERLGRVLSATVYGELTERERAEVRDLGLDLTPVSLQQLVVRATRAAEEGALR